MGDAANVGKVGWIDITVDDAEGLEIFMPQSLAGSRSVWTWAITLTST